MNTSILNLIFTFVCLSGCGVPVPEEPVPTVAPIFQTSAPPIQAPEPTPVIDE